MISRVLTSLKIVGFIIALLIIGIQYKTIQSQEREIETLIQIKESLSTKLKQNESFINQSRQNETNLSILEKGLFGNKELKNDFIHQKNIHSRINDFILHNSK